MNQKMISTLLLSVVLTAAVWTSAPAAEDETKRVQAATTVLSELMGIPEKGIPAWLLKEARAIVVIPGVFKVGFGIGGRRGHGVMVVREKKRRWSRPVFVTITGGSIGLQFGAQSTDVILVLKSERSIEGILKGKYTLGADAAIAAGPVGRQAEVATDVKLKAEIYSYSRSRGLFAGLSLEGAKLSIKKDANASFYGTDELNASGIIKSRKLDTPAVGKTFVETLERYIKEANKGG